MRAENLLYLALYMTGAGLLLAAAAIWSDRRVERHELIPDGHAGWLCSCGYREVL